jgi:hypothetical protein
VWMLPHEQLLRWMSDKPLGASFAVCLIAVFGVVIGKIPLAACPHMITVDACYFVHTWWENACSVCILSDFLGPFLGYSLGVNRQPCRTATSSRFLRPTWMLYKHGRMLGQLARCTQLAPCD